MADKRYRTLTRIYASTPPTLIFTSPARVPSSRSIYVRASWCRLCKQKVVEALIPIAHHAEMSWRRWRTTPAVQVFTGEDEGT